MTQPPSSLRSLPPEGAPSGFGRPGAAGRSGLLKLGAAMPGTPDVDHPKPERLLQGNPRRETWNVGEAAVRGTLYTGVWRCEPGHWRIAFGPHEHELFTVLQGRCRVHAEDGRYEEVGPGEALAIAPNFRGSFEVLETLTKTYAIVDGAADGVDTAAA